MADPLCSTYFWLQSEAPSFTLREEIADEEDDEEEDDEDEDEDEDDDDTDEREDEGGGYSE